MIGDIWLSEALRSLPRRHIFVRPFETKMPWFTSRNDAWLCKTSTARSFQLLFSSLPVAECKMNASRLEFFKKEQIQKWVTCEPKIGHRFLKSTGHWIPLNPGTRSTTGNWISADATTSRSRHMTMPWSLRLCNIKKPSWRLFWRLFWLSTNSWNSWLSDYLRIGMDHDGSISKVSKACFAHH